MAQPGSKAGVVEMVKTEAFLSTTAEKQRPPGAWHPAFPQGQSLWFICWADEKQVHPRCPVALVR
jgi:hypothetical protein